VGTKSNEPSITESFLEHRQDYAAPWVNRWAIPNPFIDELFPILRGFGVELTNISFNKEAANVGENYLNFAIPKLSAAIRLGLDHLTFLVANPDWSIAPQLVEIFDSASMTISKFVGAIPKSQKLTLAFHVLPGPISFGERTASLVQVDRLGPANFFGISLYRDDRSIVIDRSQRHDGAAYIRMERTFGGEVSFADIAPQLYEDEKSALALLDITGID